MAGIDDLFKGNIVTGLAVGVGVAILAPVIVPVLASVGKPLAKSMIKSGILMFEKGRETVAELGEVFDDLVAEAKVELEGAGMAPTAGAAMAAAQAKPAAEAAETQVQQGDVA
ncbi:MAG: DUF5132 domain-containing protein [Hydrogenophilaceae bacterium]|nr:DUF5132 domain-containing protein [Hydrogenophilaceae bacterium]